MVVKLKPGAPDSLNCKLYPLSRAEWEEWDKFVAKNKALEHIKDTDSSWSCPVFFIKKKDGSYRLVQDYCSINKWTKHDVYPMPWIDHILDQLHGKTLFIALDIWDGYNNIWIHNKDQWKLAFKGLEGHYKPKVMYFGMSNAPAVF
jgi:hypothetical protein